MPASALSSSAHFDIDFSHSWVKLIAFQRFGIHVQAVITRGIQFPDKSGFRIFHNCLVVECSNFQMTLNIVMECQSDNLYHATWPFENRTQKSLVFGQFRT